jgi:aldose 1-epimerase
MFLINSEKFAEFDCVNIENKAQGIELQIIHGFGAIINKLIVNNSPFSFIKGYQSGQELKKTNPFYSRSAKLFPFVNRLNNGTYSHHNKNYQLPANFPWSEQHAVHGLVYNQPFTLTEQQTNSDFARLRFCLQSDSLNTGFPFSVKLEIEYIIEASGQLSCATKITNTGLESFPFADGFHPYFNLGQSLKSCQIQMRDCLKVETSDDLPNGKLEVFSQFSNPVSLADMNLNDCYHFPEYATQDAAIQIELSRQDQQASLHYWQNNNLHNGYRFLQLYTPAGEDTLAIEPMTGPADAFNNKIGLQTLSPNESVSLIWGCLACYNK